MLEKKRLKRNYIDVQTNIDDFNNLSEGILNITSLPEVFTAGKNLFKFSPNFDVIDIGSPIYIEILDSEGETIFHEVLEYQEKDNSINVSVYVYESTPPGECTLTILCSIFVDRDGNPLNSEEIFDKNYKYTHNLKVNNKKKNNSEIIYLHYPQVSIHEKTYSILEERFDSEKQQTITGFGDYFLSDEKVPILRARENLFKKDYENATIWFPYISNEVVPNFTTSSFSYTSSVQKVLTPYQLYLENPLYVSSSRNISDEILSSINQPYYITYNNISKQRNSTKNIKSFAVVDIHGLDPEAGNVSRLKVFGKSSTKPNSSYELFYDGQIPEKNYLVSSSNYFVEIPIGVFSDEITIYDFDTKTTSSVNPYSFWQTTSIKGAPTATISSGSNYLLNPISIKPDGNLSDKQEIILEQKPEYAASFKDNTLYSLVFSYSVENNKYDLREPLLNVYASGSAFVNNTEYGAFVAEIPLTNHDDRFKLDYSINLPVNNIGTGVIKFLMRDGSSISDIKILSKTNFGFTPDITRLYVPIKTDHRNEFLDFKIEYFNESLQQSNITSELYSIFFKGGNVYIYGDDSIITGSQEVTNDSVIKSEGFKGIDEAKKNVIENNPLTYYFRTTTRGKHSAYVKYDNTLWTWGLNDSRQLGLGDIVNRSSPVQVGTLKYWASASAGDSYTMAITTSGSLWGWGANTNRQVGAGVATSIVSSPTQVGTDTDWYKVVAGTQHTLAIKKDGTLWSWGRNSEGQLGLGDTTLRSLPVQVGSTWKDIAVGSFTTVGIKTDGTLWSWGDNDPTLGQGAGAIDRSLPVQIGNATNWKNIFGNQTHYMATNTLDEIWTWGYGGNNILGQGADSSWKSSPVQVGTLKTWVSASTGKYHSLAIKNDGTLWGWGYNIRGALGQNDTVTRSLPTQIGTASNWLYTHGGQDFTFAIDRSGSFYAWGDNDIGQLGNGNTTIYSASIRISTSSVRPISKSLFGWSMHVGDPFKEGIVQNSVHFINEDGGYLNFHSYPAKLDMTFLGTSSRLYVAGESASILWDGQKLKIDGAEITASSFSGSISSDSLPAGLVSGSPQTLEHLYGTNIVSGADQRFVLGLAETDSPRFANLTLDGDLTARQYIVSSSVYIVTQSFSSGSTIFGDDNGDTHQFTGSVYITDSLFATASNAISSSYALTASYFDGLIVGHYTGSLTGSLTGSMIGDGSGSFSGSHFGSASLSGSFDGIFRGQGSGSFSGSHFGSASLSGSFKGEFDGTVVNGIVRGYPSTYQHILGGNYTASNIITVRNSATIQPHVYQNNDILFKDWNYVPDSFTFSGSTFFTRDGSNYNDYLGRGRFGSDDSYYKNIVIGRNPLYDQTINLNANTKVSPGATLTVNRLVVRDASDWPYGTPSGFAMIYPASAKIEGLEGTGSLQGAFTGSARIGILSASQANLTGSLRGAFSGSAIVGILSASQANLTGSLRGFFTGSASGSFTGSASGSFYGSGSIGTFTGVGSGSFIGYTNPGTSSFYGLVSSASYVEVFENSGTWYKPFWARIIKVICIGGGGAGGRGSNSNVAALRCGGGGGAGGNVSFGEYDAGLVDNSVNITVGSGGNPDGTTVAARTGTTSAFGGTGTNIGIYSPGNHSHGARQIAYGGEGGADAPATSAAGAFVNGGSTLSTLLPEYIPGGPGGIGFPSNAQRPNLSSISLPQDPGASGIQNGFYSNVGSIAPTGGGGGGGLSATVNQFIAGAPGGGIRDALISGAVGSQFRVHSNTKKVMDGSETIPLSIYLYNTFIGLGGRGGGSLNTTSPVAGGKYGGGGGGGRAQANGLAADIKGASGGPGVVIVISEA